MKRNRECLPYLIKYLRNERSDRVWDIVYVTRLQHISDPITLPNSQMSFEGIEEENTSFKQCKKVL
jgi:hypothetical protein